MLYLIVMKMVAGVQIGRNLFNTGVGLTSIIAVGLLDLIIVLNYNVLILE